MRVRAQLLDCIHLDPGYALLSVQNCISVLEMFRMMDIHNNASLNDCQFQQFIRSITDLNKQQTDTIFELLDIDQSGEMEFDEFYLVFCILISCKDQYEKEFIYRHSMNIFRLIDLDDSKLISAPEFLQMGVLFNFDYNSIHTIFNAFDVSGDKNLDFTEFRLFTMACIDEQRCADAQTRVKSLANYHLRLLHELEFLIRIYYITHKLPTPRDMGHILKTVHDPFIREEKHRYSFLDWQFLRSKLSCKRICIHQCKMIWQWLGRLLRLLCCYFCICRLGKKIKTAIKDSDGWKLASQIRRKRYRQKVRDERLPHNMYLTIRKKRNIERQKRTGKIAAHRASQQLTGGLKTPFDQPILDSLEGTEDGWKELGRSTLRFEIPTA